MLIPGCQLFPRVAPMHATKSADSWDGGLKLYRRWLGETGLNQQIIHQLGKRIETNHIDGVGYKVGKGVDNEWDSQQNAPCLGV